MTQEQKELLLKDLFARIPYGVKVNAPFTSNKNENSKGYKINGIKFCIVEWTPILFGEKKQRNSIVIEAFSEKYNQYCSIDIELDNNIEEVKPYLFPLSSMTEEQKEEYTFIVNYISQEDTENWSEGEFIYVDKVDALVHFYHKHHLDYRGLIPKNLAIDATKLNIY